MSQHNQTTQQFQQLESQLEAKIKELEGEGMRHGEGLLVHISKLYEAVKARDWRGMLAATRDLIDHFLGTEVKGLGSDAAAVGAFPWAVVIQLALQLIEMLRNR